MSDNSRSGASSSGSGEASELAAKFATYQRWQTISRVQTFAGLVVIAGLFGAFAKTTYEEVTGAFTPERTQAAAQKALQDVAPKAFDTFGPVFAEVLPVYQQTAAERFPSLCDRVTTNASVRLQTLPEETGQIFAETLKRSFERSTTSVEPDLYAAFPGLADPAARDVMKVYFHEAIEAKNAEIAARFNAIATNEASRVHAVLEKFQLPSDKGGPTNAELNRDLVRALVQLAGKELEQATDIPHNGSLLPSVPSASIGGN